MRWPLPTFGVILGLERFVAGQWDDALAELEACLELAGELGEENYTVNLAHAIMALISFHRDDLNRSAAAAHAANQQLESRGAQFARWAVGSWTLSDIHPILTTDLAILALFHQASATLSATRATP